MTIPPCDLTGDLFDGTWDQPQPVLPARAPAVRRSDPQTSHAAAALVTQDGKRLSELQQRVLDAFRDGPMTAKAAEELERFDDFSPSTIRKRISELARAGLLESAGVDTSGRAPLTIYRINPNPGESR